MLHSTLITFRLSSSFLALKTRQLFLLSVLLSAFVAEAQTVSSGAGSGAWNDPASWTPNVVPVNPTGTVTVLAGHTITVTDTRSIDQLTVNGTLIVNNGFVLTIANGPSATPDMTIAAGGILNNIGSIAIANGASFPVNLCQVSVLGSFENAGSITFGNASSRLTFQASSIYDHKNTTTPGTIPGGSNTTWNATSTCRISGYTTNLVAPGNLGQSFGNFVWDTQNLDLVSGAGGGIFDLNGALNNVQGNITVESTGAFGDALFLTASTGYTLSTVDNFVVNGGFVALTSSADINLSVSQNFSVGAAGAFAANLDAANSSLDIDGDLLIDGYFDFSASTGTTNLTLGGDIDAVGTVTLSGGDAYILFDGTLQSINNSLDFPSPSNISFTVGDGIESTILNLSGNYVRIDGDFTVDSNSILEIGNLGSIQGAGAFVSNTSSILRVGSTHSSGAIQTGTSNGNIRVSGARTYSAGSTIVYNGTAAQFLGNGHPSIAGIKTEISNTSGVTLAANVTIGGDLELVDLASSSNLSISNRTLTLNGNFEPNDNFLNVLATSSIVINGSGAFGTLVTTGSTTINNFTINRTAGSVTLGSNLTIAGTFTQTVGDIILNGQTLTVSGPYSRTDGSINGDASASVIINGSGALPTAVQFSGTQSLNTLTINRASSTLATSSTLTLTSLNLLLGTFNNVGTITMNDGGVLTRTEGSILNNRPTTNPTTNSYDVIYNIATNISSGSEIPALTTQLRNLTKTGGATLSLTEAITINGVLTLTNGNFNASTFAIDLKGNFVANSTSTLTSSPFTFSGTTVISGGSIVQFGAVNITGSLTPTINIRIDGNLVNDGTLNAGTGSQTVTFGGTTTISGGSVHNFNAVTVAGALTAPSSMNVAGNFTFSSGTFTSSNGTVVFNGTSSISGAPSFHNVTVTGTLNGPTNLNVTGDLALNGVFNSGSGRITFNGTANQRIDRTSGSATTINLFDVTVNKANGTFNIASTVANTVFRVQNEFTIAQAGANTPDIDFDGPLDAGRFVLGSSSTRTAKITAVPAGTQILGNLTVERFVQNAGGVRNWRYLSSPVVGATVADWQGEIQITGLFSDPSTGAGITNPNNPSLYRYTETTGGAFNARYERWPNNISLPASSFALENGRGYSVFVRDTGTPTMNVRGTLRFGDVGIALTSTGSEPDAAGFNLVGNPYPAPINWDLVTLPGGVSSTISMIDNVSNGGLGGGQFVYYVQGGPNVGTFTGDIGSSQAFWVETTSGTTLTFTEAHKSSENNPVIVREKQIANLLRIRVEGNGKKDETVVYFKDRATDNYDLKYDARKRENEFISLFTHIEGDQGLDKYAINGLQGIDCSREIRLGLEKFTEGTYTFLFSEMESFDNRYQFRLIDNFAGTSVSVNDQAYVFTVTNNPASYGFERFKVIISEGAIESNLAVLGDKKCDSKNLQITLGSSQEGISYQPFYNGAVVGDPMIGNGNQLTLALKENVFTPGLAEVSVKAFNACGELFLDQKASIEVVEFVEAAIDTQGNTLVSNYPNGNQWSVDGVEIPGANGQSLEATKSGTYTLVVTTGECSTSAERSFVITGNETSFSSFVRVYPNTFRQKFNVEVESSAPVHARVFSAMGVMVAEQQLNGSDTIKSGEFDLTGTADGMYILYIHKGNAVHQVKIIKSAE